MVLESNISAMQVKLLVFQEEVLKKSDDSGLQQHYHTEQKSRFNDNKPLLQTRTVTLSIQYAVQVGRVLRYR